LADVVEVKTGSRSTAHWRINFIRSNGWLGNSFAQLITLLDIDGIGQNWEGSNITSAQAYEEDSNTEETGVSATGTSFCFFLYSGAVICLLLENGHVTG